MSRTSIEHQIFCDSCQFGSMQESLFCEVELKDEETKHYCLECLNDPEIYDWIAESEDVISFSY